MNVVINFSVYQLGWFVCILGAANGAPWAGPAVLGLAIAYHLRCAARPGRELGLIVLAGVIGTTWDSILVSLGWLVYPSGMLVDGLAPYWMTAMWLGFATTLNVSLRWLKGRLALATALGMVAGPLAYLAGEKLGGVIFVEPMAATLALAIGWSLIMPTLVVLSNHCDGFPANPQRRGSRTTDNPALSAEHV